MLLANWIKFAALEKPSYFCTRCWCWCCCCFWDTESICLHLLWNVTKYIHTYLTIYAICCFFYNICLFIVIYFLLKVDTRAHNWNTTQKCVFLSLTHSPIYLMKINRIIWNYDFSLQNRQKEEEEENKENIQEIMTGI